MDNKQSKFKDWLIDEINRRRWSLRELARKTNYSHSHISNVVNGKKPVTFDFCNEIAEALDYPAWELFVLAGLMDHPGDIQLNDETAIIVDIYQQTPRKHQKEIFEYVKWYGNRHKEDD